MRDNACSDGLTQLATSAVRRGWHDKQVLTWMLNNGIRPGAANRALQQAQAFRQESSRKKLTLSMVGLFTVLSLTAITNVISLLSSMS
ncbi:hypothetical protein IQ22_03383 [Pseudomonas duriflava]|uniref:Uncharacterized protein n=1 Tax=Pseudomonas duriflava TaxID=459528 RepID=A0A562Q7A1_9PSED|nr:hypothetical protein IQ22_03383 [Pseudomonas duriflava]